MFKKIIIFTVFLSLGVLSSSQTIKVIKRKSDNKIVYRSIPTFEDKQGLNCVLKLYGGNIIDYEINYLTVSEWNSLINKQNKSKENNYEYLVKQKEYEILRKMAIVELKAEGKIPSDYK